MHALNKMLMTVMIFGLGGLLSVGPAAAFSKQVEKACLADYKNLCPQYRVNSSQLRACMESKANEISWACKSALIDSGEVGRKHVRR